MNLVEGQLTADQIRARLQGLYFKVQRWTLPCSVCRSVVRAGVKHPAVRRVRDLADAVMDNLGTEGFNRHRQSRLNDMQRGAERMEEIESYFGPPGVLAEFAREVRAIHGEDSKARFSG